MKVLQIINSLGAGGAEKLVVDSCIQYNLHGLDVDILLLDGTETPFYNILKFHKNISIFTLGKHKNIYNPLNILKIKSKLKHYDLIHVHLFPASYWVAFSKLLSFKKPQIIFTEHNSTNRRRNILIFKCLDTIVYKQFNKVVTISEAVDTNLKKHLGASISKKIVKIYNGIDLLAIENATPYSKEHFGYKETDTILIQVSSFTPQKDQKTVIKALSLLPESYKLLLVGDGPLLKDYITFSTSLNLQDRIKFLGIRNDVPKLLKTSDVVILSSYYEGLSLSCIEGMASGKPFIASNVPGLGDIVANFGLLFELENANELADKIVLLWQDKETYNNLIASCTQRAKVFDIKKMVKNYINLYNETIIKN